MADINTKLANALISHMLSLQRLENGAVKRLMETLKDAKKDIQRILDANSAQIPTGTDVFGTMTPFQRQRLEDTIAEIDQVLRIATLKLNNELTVSLNALAGNETEILAAILNKQIPESLGLRLTFDRLPLDVIQQMVDTPLGGLTYSERLRRTYGDALDRIKASLTDSLIQGNTIKQAAQAITVILGDTLANKAEQLARDEYARVANQAASIFFKTNERFISVLIFTSSLDLKVCIKCARLHGKEFPIDTKFIPPGSTHSRCRCNYTVRLKSAKELGIEDEEIPEFAKKALDGSKPLIPLDFNEFLKGFSKEERVEMLGKTRAAMFERGVRVQDMATDKRILTLDELRAKVN